METQKTNEYEGEHKVSERTRRLFNAYSECLGEAVSNLGENTQEYVQENFDPVARMFLCDREVYGSLSAAYSEMVKKAREGSNKNNLMTRVICTESINRVRAMAYDLGRITRRQNKKLLEKITNPF